MIAEFSHLSCTDMQQINQQTVTTNDYYGKIYITLKFNFL